MLSPCLVQGVANRDLKLENLLLDKMGSGNKRPLLKICDFGYAKHDFNSPATTGVGTPIYMAPEIIYGSTRYDAKVCKHAAGGSRMSCCLTGGGGAEGGHVVHRHHPVRHAVRPVSL